MYFDFISIDAPFGSDVYSRIDVLDIIPDCLMSSFIIMIDDYNRIGEQNTVKEIMRRFSDRNISVCSGSYRGAKQSLLITTEDYKFLCTL
ncbi:hypothetical protein FACS1894216_17910 [Synergistales bacterium]|nr:hypothetical protein FACS1894216_17910 [Synergistales bacterium]